MPYRCFLDQHRKEKHITRPLALAMRRFLRPSPGASALIQRSRSGVHSMKMLHLVFS